MVADLESNKGFLQVLNDEPLEAFEVESVGLGVVVEGFEADAAAGILPAVLNMHIRSRFTIMEGRRSWNYTIGISSES